MKKTRILQLFYEPHSSGISRHVACLAKGLDRAGYDVRVLCSTSDERIRVTFESLLGKGRVNIVPPGRFFSFKGAYEARRIISDEQIELVHVHNLQSMLWGYAAGLASKSTRIVFTPHVIDLPVRCLEKGLRFALRLVKPFTFRIIALSPHQEERLVRNRAAAAPNIRVIPNRLDLAEIAAKISRDPQKVRRNLNIPPDVVVVCQIGRLVRQKNPLALVRIAEQVCGRHPHVVFLLVGEGPLRKTVQDALKARCLEHAVRLLGFRSDALDIANASDIVTLTSLWEGQPYTIIEAIALRKPVVCTDFPGIRELIIHGQTGLVAKTEDDFATALTALAENPSMRQAMGEKALQTHGDLFDLERMILEVEEAYGL
jgi:glycosyltransferase involved in cell wall biosynthesis